jgi:hypothetical protein
MTMRISDILGEAPIADLAMIDDPNDKGWHKADKALLNSPKAVGKIMNMFERTPFVFNFYMVMTGKGFQSFGGNHDEKKVLEFLEKAFHKKIDTDGKITIAYSLNGVGNKRDMPMNAWTMAHRIIHTLQIRRDYLEFEETFWKNLVDITNYACPAAEARFVPQGGPIEFARPERTLVPIASALMTMKSARDDNFQSSLDLAGEVMAQYLFTGKIKFRKAHEFVELANERLAKHSVSTVDPNSAYPTKRYIPVELKPKDYAELDRLIAYASKDCERALVETLNEMKGGVFAF